MADNTKTPVKHTKTEGSYKKDMQTAYQKGYVKGWEDATALPKRFGSVAAATHGYKKGVKTIISQISCSPIRQIQKLNLGGFYYEEKN